MLCKCHKDSLALAQVLLDYGSTVTQLLLNTNSIPTQLWINSNSTPTQLRFNSDSIPTQLRLNSNSTLIQLLTKLLRWVLSAVRSIWADLVTLLPVPLLFLSYTSGERLYSIYNVDDDDQEFMSFWPPIRQGDRHMLIY